MVLAPVLALHRKRGRPSKADILRMELDSRRLEELRMADHAAPLIRRLYVVAEEIGPACWQTVAALDALHRSHARRWRRDGEDDAA